MRSLTLLWLAMLAVADARAAIVPAGPFSGGQSETWESFSNYSDHLAATGGPFLADPTPILGGDATISGPRLAVYEPAVGAIFSLGSSGVAGVSNGVKSIGSDIDAGATSVVFVTEVESFGAYWGALTGPDFPFPNPTSVTVAFFDASDVLLGSDSFDYSRASSRDGALEWHGWRSTGAGIKKVTISGDYVALDGLQAAGPLAVPASSWLGRLAFGLLLGCAVWAAAAPRRIQRAEARDTTDP
jgi:hypothetical protein